jgi:hypothetical protein
MNKAILFFYTLIGFIIGWIMGSSLSPNPETSFHHLLLAVGSMLVFGALAWVDSLGRSRIQNNWSSIRSKGKWRFVVVYHLLIRGIILMLFLLLLPYASVGFTRPVLTVLIPATVFLFGALIFLGHQEWQENELSNFKNKRSEFRSEER